MCLDVATVPLSKDLTQSEYSNMKLIILILVLGSKAKGNDNVTNISEFKFCNDRCETSDNCSDLCPICPIRGIWWGMCISEKKSKWPWYGEDPVPGGGCFPGDSQVLLEDGLMKRMEELRIGDTIRTVENGDLVSTEVLGFLDKRLHSMGEYLSISLEDGKSLSISGRHVMFIHGEDNTVKSILAKDVTISDMVYVQYGEKTGMTRVVDIILEQKTGAYVPLTMAGTLLVDGVLVSSYTNTGHWLAHTAMAPLRWFPTLLLDTEHSQDDEGMRVIPGMLQKVGNVLGLITTTKGMQEEHRLEDGIGNMGTCAVDMGITSLV